MTDVKTITTPQGKVKLVLKRWITGRERREIDNAALIGMNVTIEDGVPVIPAIDATIANKIEDKSIEVIVKSVDGNVKDVLKTVLDLHAKDYDYVLDQVNIVLEGDLTDAKKKQ